MYVIYRNDNDNDEYWTGYRWSKDPRDAELWTRKHDAVITSSKVGGVVIHENATRQHRD
jgi:hypothetical protein